MGLVGSRDAWMPRLEAGVLAIALASTAAVSASPSRQARPEPPPATALVIDEEEIDWLRSILANASNGVEIRRRAADKLLRMPTPLAPAAVASVFDEVSDAERGALQAVFRNATLEAPDLAEAVVDALALALPKDRPRLLMTIADLGPGADELVAVVALDGKRDPRTRVSAVEALGGFPTRTAAESLLALLEEGREEGAEIRTAALRSLERISGVPLGDDAESWRRWWREGGESSLERTCEERIGDLAAQIGRLDRDRRGLEDRADRTANRLRAILADVLVGLEPAARQERVQRLLADELEPLRSLAVDQLDRAFRNGDRLGDETIARLAGLLDDPSRTIRGKAARLLSNLGWEPISEEVARRLQSEFDPELATIYLDVLAERPRSDSFPLLSERLVASGTSDAAARAMARLVTAGLAPADWAATVGPVVRPLVTDAPTAATVRLLALAGDDSDRALLESILERDAVALRRAVADGWTRGGRLGLLRGRLRDPAINAAVVAAIARMPPSLDSVSMLLGVERPVEVAAQVEYDAALLQILGGLPVSDLAEGDDRLASAGIGVETRLASLRRASATDLSALTPRDRERLLERNATLLMRLDRAEEAADLLEPYAIMTEQALSAILFEARLRAGRFDRATAQHASPGPWAEVLDRLAVSDPAAAQVLADEIERRFAGRLSPEQAQRVAAIRRALEVVPEGPPVARP